MQTPHRHPHPPSESPWGACSPGPVDASPRDPRNGGRYPHYCPICMLHHRRMFQCVQCAHGICGGCAEGLLRAAAKSAPLCSIIAEEGGRRDGRNGVVEMSPVERGAARQTVTGRVRQGFGGSAARGTGTSYYAVTMQSYRGYREQAGITGNADYVGQGSLYMPSLSMGWPPVLEAPIVACPYCSRVLRLQRVAAGSALRNDRDSPAVRIPQAPPKIVVGDGEEGIVSFASLRARLKPIEGTTVPSTPYTFTPTRPPAPNPNTNTNPFRVAPPSSRLTSLPRDSDGGWRLGVPPISSPRGRRSSWCPLM